MKRLHREILANVIATGGVILLASYGVRGWKLAVLILVLLVVYFRPRRDPVKRRERRIERQATLMATLIEDMQEIIPRAMEKMHSPSHEDLPTAIEPGDLGGHVPKSD